eukprot:640851-Pyramimonas_sp.AAC.1
MFGFVSLDIVASAGLRLGAWSGVAVSLRMGIGTWLVRGMWPRGGEMEWRLTAGAVGYCTVPWKAAMYITLDVRASHIKLKPAPLPSEKERVEGLAM